jgi:transglutaminase-like putative cysteine protease
MPTPIILMLRPRSGAGQWVASETYFLAPEVSATEYTDMYGNLCQRLLAPAGHFTVRTSTEVTTAEMIDVEPGAPFTLAQHLPIDALPFLLPSRYCEADQLGALATDIVGDAKPGYDQVAAICRWIYRSVVYRYGVINASTSARDTVAQREGVCRDFAHLGIALCRSLDIPARMVVGYLYRLKPMDMHAWFEAFVGGRWYTFDPTQEHARGGRIAIAYGRDATDVALATWYGEATMSPPHVTVEQVECEG